jgi:hypothetical protein
VTGPFTNDETRALAALVLSRLSGLWDDLHLGLLRLIVLVDRSLLAAAAVLSTLAGLLTTDLLAIVASALPDGLLAGDLALTALAADGLVIGDDAPAIMALLAADLAVHRAVIATRGRPGA